MQAQKISRKAAAAGFEWDALDDVWAKVREETAELQAAYKAAPKAANGKVDASVAPSAGAADAAAAVAAVELEFGDMLFSLVNVARRMGVDAEGALRATCAKFRTRWAAMEAAAAAQAGASRSFLPTSKTSFGSRRRRRPAAPSAWSTARFQVTRGAFRPRRRPPAAPARDDARPPRLVPLPSACRAGLPPACPPVVPACALRPSRILPPSAAAAARS